MLTLATTLASGNGGCSQNALLPTSPRSSPVKQTKATLRGSGPALASASASRITAVVPVASSSAPL